MLKKDDYIDVSVSEVIKIKGTYGFRTTYTLNDGSKKVAQKSGFKLKRDAKAARDELMIQLSSDEEPLEPIKMCDLLDAWLLNKLKVNGGLRYNTYNNFKNTIEYFLKPVFKSMLASEVTSIFIYKILTEDAPAHYKSTDNSVKTVLNMTFNFAVHEGFLKVSPMPKRVIKRKKKNGNLHELCIDPKKVLNQEQLNRLLSHSKGSSLYLPLLLCTMLGLRKAEMFAVKYSDIDYVHKTISIERQIGKFVSLDEDDNVCISEYKETDLKTFSSKRTLEIPEMLFEQILQQRKIYDQTKQELGDAFSDTDYIVCNKNGTRRSREAFYKLFKKALKDCGLPDIRWHDLRSSYCTLLLKQGFSPKAVSKLMGHAKTVVTVDVYGDNREILESGLKELEEYIEGLDLPKKKALNEALDVELDNFINDLDLDRESEKVNLLDVVIDTSFLGRIDKKSVPF